MVKSPSLSIPSEHESSYSSSAKPSGLSPPANPLKSRCESDAKANHGV